MEEDIKPSENSAPVPGKAETKIVYKEKNRLSNFFTRTLLSLLLVAAGVAIVWLWLQWRDARNAATAKSNELVSLNQTLRTLQDDVAVYRAEDTANRASEQSQLADQLLLAAKAYVSADTGVSADEFNSYSFTISKQSDDFGRVSVGVPEGAGFYIVFKRSIKQWVPLVSGQDTVPQTTADKYGIPADFR